jgi:excinuclease ABC subunit A
MQKPEVEYIEGLPPTISIEQRSGGGTPRSTVATTTEIYDYLRLLFARVGAPHCPGCGKPIAQQTREQMVAEVLKLSEGTRVMVMSPLVRGRKGEHREVFQRIRREGFVRARVDGVLSDVKQAKALDKNTRHTIEAVVDRLVIKEGIRGRLADSMETALTLGEGLAVVSVERQASSRADSGKAGTAGGWEDHVYSELYACPECNISIEELSPRLFSFNSPYGACQTCDGLGTKLEFDPELIVPDGSLSLAAGAIDAWRRGGKRMAIYYSHVLRDFCTQFGVSRDLAFNDIAKEIRQALLLGTTRKQEEKLGAEFEGVIPNLERRFERTTSEYVKQRLHGYMSEAACPACGGARLRPEALAVRVDGHNISQVSRMSITAALAWFEGLRLNAERRIIAQQVLKEIRSRLTFLADVGLEYLTLDRMSRTLAGGEAQRIRLATQVGSGLVGVCYVLDEPSIGLHQRDNRRLLNTLLRLRDLGNTVIVVEHDEQTIRSADHIIDLGPGAGAHGGEVVAEGPLEAILASERSTTAAYLNGTERIEVPERRRKALKGHAITVYGAREHNLKNINVKVPLGVFVCVTGVSGSGKSTLVSEILHRALMRKLYGSKERPGEHDRVSGTEKIDKVIEIDQSPIGRTPRSNPATYTNLLDLIRQLFAHIREAKIRGYKPGRFSFNVKGGRCEACQGQGTKKIEMHFLPDIYVVCEECKGRRFNRETLEIRYKGKSIAEVLDMTVEESLKFFENFPKIKRILETLNDVGLGYVQMGQSSTTLSGGEAQRIKLAAELGKTSTGNTFYILDEPTTGLHFADIHRLLHVLNRLTDLGNTVLVIEHNLDVIKCADWIIDLGPEGGDRGGQIVVEGTPEEVTKHPTSYTGQFLKEHLGTR